MYLRKRFLFIIIKAFFTAAIVVIFIIVNNQLKTKKNNYFTTIYTVNSQTKSANIKLSSSWNKNNTNKKKINSKHGKHQSSFSENNTTTSNFLSGNEFSTKTNHNLSIATSGNSSTQNKKNNEKNTANTTTFSAGSFNSQRRGSRLIAQNNYVPFSDNSEKNHVPNIQRVDGEGDPGEPPAPLGDNLWILLCFLGLYVYRFKVTLK